MIKLDNISGRLTPPHLDTVYVCEKNNLKIAGETSTSNDKVQAFISWFLINIFNPLTSVGYVNKV